VEAKSTIQAHFGCTSGSVIPLPPQNFGVLELLKLKLIPVSSTVDYHECGSGYELFI